MKKILVLAAALVLAASTGFSADNAALDFSKVGMELRGDRTTADDDTALIGKTSTGVAIAWQTHTSAYALMTQHKNGTKAFGSSYDSTAIYQTIAETSPGTAAISGGALTASDTTDFVDTSVWKAM